MKKPLLITLVSFFLFSVSYAGKEASPNGVYMTLQDFKNGKLIKADQYISLKPVKHSVEMKVNGELKEYKCADIFGILVNGHLYRFTVGTAGTAACQMMMYTDKYVWWQIDETTFHIANAQNMSTAQYISSGLNGELVFMALGTKADKLLEHKGFGPIVNCAQTGKRHNFFIAVQECLTQDPTFKRNGDDAIPPIK